MPPLRSQLHWQLAFLPKNDAEWRHPGRFSDRDAVSPRDSGEVLWPSARLPRRCGKFRKHVNDVLVPPFDEAIRLQVVGGDLYIANGIAGKQLLRKGLVLRPPVVHYEQRAPKPSHPHFVNKPRNRPGVRLPERLVLRPTAEVIPHAYHVTAPIRGYRHVNHVESNLR